LLVDIIQKGQKSNRLLIE